MTKIDSLRTIFLNLLFKQYKISKELKKKKKSYNAAVRYLKGMLSWSSNT